MLALFCLLGAVGAFVAPIESFAGAGRSFRFMLDLAHMLGELRARALLAAVMAGFSLLFFLAWHQARSKARGES
jgi:hypothetical protein